MHHYQHHIGDFNNATRHLSRLERAIYRDLIDLYYETEMPLQCDRIALARRALVKGDEEVAAMDAVLTEFFSLEADGYHNSRCDAELARLYEKSAAARASAEKRWAKNRKKTAKNANAMRTQCDGNATHNPLTHNPLTSFAQSPPAEASSLQAVIELPTNRFNTTGEVFLVTEDMLPDWIAAYPAVDIRQDLHAARAWLMDNQAKRKTASGMRKFLGSWFTTTQNRGGNRPQDPGTLGYRGRGKGGRSSRDIPLAESLNDTSWADGVVVKQGDMQ